MLRYIVIIFSCVVGCSTLHAQQHDVKKLKGFEANCDAAARYFLDSDVNGQEFYNYLKTAYGSAPAYHEAEAKHFTRAKDSVRYARSLLKTSFVKLVMLEEVEDPKVYQSGMEDFETALRIARKEVIKNELLPVYLVLIQLDFAMNRDRIGNDLDNIKSLTTDSSFFYLTYLAVHVREKGRFLKAEEIALRAKRKARPASNEVFQANKLLQSIYVILGENERALRMAEENMNLIAARGRRDHHDFYWSVFYLTSFYLDMAQWEKARKLYEQNIRDMTRDDKSRKLYGDTRVLFNSYNRLMWLNFDTGEKDAADSLFRIQKRIVDHFREREDNLYADDCAALAVYYAEAREDYDSAIILEKIVLDFGRRSRIRLFEMEGVC